MSDFLDHPTAIRSGEELDLGRLEPFLRRHFPNEEGALQVHQFPSGHSNLTYSLHLGAKELVLRRPPFGSKVKSAHDMSREFRVLSKLHSVYAPAPEVLLYCDDASVIGAPFYVMQTDPRHHSSQTVAARFGFSSGNGAAAQRILHRKSHTPAPRGLRRRGSFRSG
jgi:hypothetical protein